MAPAAVSESTATHVEPIPHHREEIPAILLEDTGHVILANDCGEVVLDNSINTWVAPVENCTRRVSEKDIVSSVQPLRSLWNTRNMTATCNTSLQHMSVAIGISSMACYCCHNSMEL